MPDTKKIVAFNAAIGIPCAKRSSAETVVLRHIEPGKPVVVDAGEAERLIALGFAEEVKAEKPPTK